MLVKLVYKTRELELLQGWRRWEGPSGGQAEAWRTFNNNKEKAAQNYKLCFNARIMVGVLRPEDGAVELFLVQLPT